MAKQHYKLGQEVYVIDDKSIYGKCPICNGKGRKGKWVCLECDGGGTVYKYSRRTIFKVKIITATLFTYEDRKPKDHISYMFFYNIDIGSGYREYYKNKNDLYKAVFPTKELAQKALKGKGEFERFKK